MGVLNVTPDSFSDGGTYFDPAAAEERALEMERQGAHLLDIGAESSRPGAPPVPAEEEIRRLRPVLKRVSKRIKIPLSVDTCKTEVARFALDEGAQLINDIRALGGNTAMAKLIARRKAGVILMHMRGTPETMQRDTTYVNLMKEVMVYLKKAVRVALDAGIPKESIVVDPGFGFGKSTSQNFEMLDRFHEFEALKLPVLVGLSRKSFLGHALGAGVNDRLYGSLGAAAVAVSRGAHIVRVHDVEAHRQFFQLFDAVPDGRAA